MDTQAFIHTNRLILQKLNSEIQKELFEWRTEDERMSFFGFTSFEELQNQKERYEKGMSTFNKSFEYFYLRDKNSNKVIGWCGFHTWYVVHKRAEIGYVMTDESFRGQGMMTEAMARILKYGFETMHLHRVEAFVGKGNRASRNLLEHSGFKKEGLLKEHYFKEGVMEDSLLYALLQSEYETR